MKGMQEHSARVAEEKAALKATGLFSDSEDDEEEAQDTDEEEEEAPDAEKSDAEKSDAEKSDAESEEEDAPAATEDPAPSGRRARAKPEAEAENSRPHRNTEANYNQICLLPLFWMALLYHTKTRVPQISPIQHNG